MMGSDRSQYDAVVVGGGHNGLVCAAYLARAGMKTIVLERRHLLGGAAVTEEVWPGFGVSTASRVKSHSHSTAVLSGARSLRRWVIT